MSATTSKHAMADQLFRLLALLDNHFAADDTFPVDADRWRELKRHITRMKDGFDLARGIEPRARRASDQGNRAQGAAACAVRSRRENRLAQWGGVIWPTARD